MKKEMIFFADKGLTSTSANYVANLAKEYIKTTESVLNNISFYDRYVELLVSGNKVQIHKGTMDITDIQSKLKEISDAKALIAWLREAIKAREVLMDECEQSADKEYLQINNIELPQCPVKKHILTEDEYYSNLSIKERNRYYSLEAEASVLGKYIHPDGHYNTARKNLAHYIQNPCNVEDKGRDTVINTYMPTISLSQVDDLFFQLQQKHREIQAQLNSIKYECEQAIISSKTAVQEEYANELRKYNEIYAEIGIGIEQYKTKKLKEIGNYKIIIPDSLKSIYDKISKLGK